MRTQLRRFFIVSFVIMLITAMFVLITVAAENTRRLSSGEVPAPADFSAFSDYIDNFFDFFRTIWYHIKN